MRAQSVRHNLQHALSDQIRMPDHGSLLITLTQLTSCGSPVQLIIFPDQLWLMQYTRPAICKVNAVVSVQGSAANLDGVAEPDGWL